jgi:peptidoglycan/LPS O-acetylase OafA/YrhL
MAVVGDHLALLPTAGHRAVMLFFVLSGFVLARPWVRGESPAVTEFLIRRFWRLWPTAAAAVAIAAVGIMWTGPENWSVGLDWKGPLTAGTVGRCLTLIWPTSSCLPVPPLWSLTIEARVSLVFPFLVALTLRSRLTMLIFALSIGLSVDVPLVIYARNATLTLGPSLGMVMTLHYCALFVFGILLCRQNDSLTSWLRCRGPHWHTLLLVLAIVLLAVPADTSQGAGASILILLALQAPFARVLAFAPLYWTGRVSYSLYVIHMPVLAMATFVFGASLSAAEIVLTLVVCCLFAEALYRLVERPSNMVGSWFTRRAGMSAHIISPEPRQAR